MKDFTKYEFQERLERMTELLKDAEGWGDAYESSTGQTLIQLMTHVTDELHYMLQRRTLETYLETASLRSSVIARACELGYRFKRAKANRGTIKIALESPLSSEIIIPAFTQFESDGLYYTNTETVIIPIGETEVSFVVKQGSLVNESRDLQNGIVTLSDYELIDNDNILVNTTHGQYLDVRTQSDVNKRALSFLDPLEKFYDIKYSVNGMCIVFGDNFQGRRPESPIELTYVRVDPNIEEISSIGNEFNLVDVISGLTGNTFTITNTTRIINGSSPESNDSIRRNASDYHRTNGRAVTNSDYNFWMQEIDGIDIVDAKTFGEDEIRSLIYNLNNVYITYLKEDGEKFTTQELQIVREYMDTVKTSQAHLVFFPANILDLQLIADVRKAKNVPLSNEEFYDRLYMFFTDYFKMRKGSIGGECQSSDIVSDLYKVTFDRNNLTYPLIDFVKLKIKGVLPLSFPIKTQEAEIIIDRSYAPTQDDSFVLIFDTYPIQVVIDETDNISDILLKMRSEIISNVRVSAQVLINNIVYDYSGNPIQTENVDFGFIGNLTSPINNDSTTFRITFDSGVKTEFFYYGKMAGKKPPFPVFDGSVVNITAPNDTDVAIYFRTVVNDETTETLLTTLSQGQTYNNTFDEEGFIVYDFIDDSSFDAVSYVQHQSIDLFDFVLKVSSNDRFNSFSINSESGDLASFVKVYNTFSLANKLSESIGVNVNQNIDAVNLLLPKSIEFYDVDGNSVFVDNGEGKFIDSNGDIVNGVTVSYKSSFLVIDNDFAQNNYTVTFSQDEFDNMVVDDATAMRLIEPKPDFYYTEESMSVIRIV
jgi:hypothetical protein